MKKRIFALFIVVTCYSNVWACTPMGALFGEISFIQDSINPLKFYFKVKIIGGEFCSFQTDTCAMEWSCPFTGYYGNLPLVDTIITENTTPQFPVLIYGGWHTFDSIPPDSLLYVSFSTFGRANAMNIPGNPSQTSFNIEVTLNLAYLAYHTGIQSAYFNGAMYAYGVPFQVLYYDPEIQYQQGDSLWVTLTPPLADCNDDAGIYYPNQYLPGSHNILSMFNPTGFLIWDSPQEQDTWDIAYLVSGYRDGVFAYSMMRDMLIKVFPASTGINDITINNESLHCYPNPSDGNFIVSFSDFGIGDKAVTLYNYMGQPVYSTNTSQTSVMVNSIGLSTGMYIVQVTSNSKQETSKIVISK